MGIGGVEAALIEGQIAGFAAAGNRCESARIICEARGGEEIYGIIGADVCFAGRVAFAGCAGDTCMPLRRCESCAAGEIFGLAQREIADAMRNGRVSGTRLRRGGGIYFWMARGVGEAADISGARGIVDGLGRRQGIILFIQ